MYTIRRMHSSQTMVIFIGMDYHRQNTKYIAIHQQIMNNTLEFYQKQQTNTKIVGLIIQQVWYARWELILNITIQ